MAKDKVFTFLISEQIIGSDVAIGDMKEASYTDKTGKIIPTIIWKSILSNTSRETQNGNIFTEEELRDGFADGFVKNRLDRQAWYSEFSHPSRIDPERYCMVDDKEVSHRINSVTFERLNGDIVAVGELETSTFAYGPDLRKKIIQNAVPAVSLRAAGNMIIGSNGQERKLLRVFGYDQVFAPSDTFAWGDMKTIQHKIYAEAIHSKFSRLDVIQANESASLMYRSKIVDLNDVKGHIKAVDNNLRLIAEHNLGCAPTKVIYDNKNLVLGFYSEGITIFTKVEDEAIKSMRDFMAI